MGQAELKTTECGLSELGTATVSRRSAGEKGSLSLCLLPQARNTLSLTLYGTPPCLAFRGALVALRMYSIREGS